MTRADRLGQTPAPGTERRWFTAADLQLAIDVPRPDGPSDVALRDLEAARLLGEYDRLLAALELTLAEPLDWCPLDSRSLDDGRTPQPLACTLCLATGDKVLSAGLAEPLAANRLAALASAVLPELQCLLHRVNARVLLDRLVLEPAESGQLVPGAVVLLPSAFDEPWFLHLDAGDNGQWRARLNRDNGQLVDLQPLDETARITPDPASARELEVWFDGGVSLDFGLGESPPVQLDNSLSNAEVTLAGTAGAGLRGRLMSIGRGLGVLLDPGTT